MSATSTDTTIRELAVSAYAVPTDAPEADGTAQWSSTTVVVVEPVAADVRGLGWSYAAGAAAGLVEEMLRACVVGRDAMDVPGITEAMVRRVRNAGRSGIAATAVSAVDLALWDLKAKLLGVPLSRLLGSAHATVPIYGSGGFTTYDAERTTGQLSQWVHELGIPRVKIKIGESWGANPSRDLERVALARSVIGPDAELYVDANGGYTVGQAVRLGQRMREWDVTWFEEPVSSDDLAGLATVRQRVDADVAAGEYSYTLYDSEQLCAAGAVDCLQLDATRCGGATGWLRGAAVAAAHNLQVSAHCAPSLHASIATAVPNLRHLEYFHDHARIDRMLFDGAPDPDGGSLRPSGDRPGFGMELRRSDAEEYRVR